MTMFTKILTILFITMLSACSSKPTDNSFVGTGEFNAQEAAKTRVSLGLTYLKNGNFSQAKFNLDKALEFDPRSGEANYAMAFYYQQVDEVARAEEYYQTAIGYSRNDPDVLNSYGAFLCKQGNYEKAKEYFLQAVDDKSYIAAAQTYENLAICAQSQGLNEESKNYFLKALNHQPTRSSTLYYLAQNYIEAQEWEAAKKALWKYERNARVTAESLWMSYQIARGENDLNGAIEYADILKRLHPDHEHTKTALTQLGGFRPAMSVTQKKKPTLVLSSDSSNTTPDVATVIDKTKSETKAPLASVVDVEASVSSIDNTKGKKGETVVSASETMHDKVSAQTTAFHIVQPKENLYRISLKYNVKMKKLLEWNNLTNSSSIRIGTKLRVRDPNTNE